MPQFPRKEPANGGGNKRCMISLSVPSVPSVHALFCVFLFVCFFNPCLVSSHHSNFLVATTSLLCLRVSHSLLLHSLLVHFPLPSHLSPLSSCSPTITQTEASVSAVFLLLLWRTLPITKQEPCSFYLPRLVRPDKYRILDLNLLVYLASSIRSHSTVRLRTNWEVKIRMCFKVCFFQTEYLNKLKTHWPIIY